MTKVSLRKRKNRFLIEIEKNFMLELIQNNRPKGANYER